MWRACQSTARAQATQQNAYQLQQAAQAAQQQRVPHEQLHGCRGGWGAGAGASGGRWLARLWEASLRAAGAALVPSSCGTGHRVFQAARRVQLAQRRSLKRRAKLRAPQTGGASSLGRPGRQQGPHKRAGAFWQRPWPPPVDLAAAGRRRQRTRAAALAACIFTSQQHPLLPLSTMLWAQGIKDSGLRARHACHACGPLEVMPARPSRVRMMAAGCQAFPGTPPAPRAG